MAGDHFQGGGCIQLYGVDTRVEEVSDLYQHQENLDRSLVEALQSKTLLLSITILGLM